MPIYRVTMFLTQSTMGWSETYWTRTNVAATNIAPMISGLTAKRSMVAWTNQQFAGVRVADLGTDVNELVGKRKSILLLPGAGKLNGVSYGIPTTGSLSVTGVVNEPRPDQVRSALNLRLGWGDGYSTTRYLVGVPDKVSSTEPATLDLGADGLYLTSLNAWRAELTDRWAILAKVQPPDEPYIPGRGLTRREASPTDLGVLVDSTATPSILFGEKVHLRGWRSKKKGVISLNGTYRVSGVNTTLSPGQVIYYIGNTAGANPFDYPIFGTIQRVRNYLAAIQEVTPVRVGIHKRGRPSTAPRGRRLTRVSLDP